MSRRLTENSVSRYLDSSSLDWVLILAGVLATSVGASVLRSETQIKSG